MTSLIIFEEANVPKFSITGTVFAGGWKDPDQYWCQTDLDTDPGGPKHTDPTDPDPQHYFKA